MAELSNCGIVSAIFDSFTTHAIAMHYPCFLLGISYTIFVENFFSLNSLIKWDFMVYAYGVVVLIFTVLIVIIGVYIELSLF